MSEISEKLKPADLMRAIEYALRRSPVTETVFSEEGDFDTEITEPASLEAFATTLISEVVPHIMAAALSSAAVAEREPVAWRWKPKDSAAWIYDPKHEWLEAQSRDEIDAEPLYTRPSEQAVTEAGIEAAERTMAAHCERPLKAWELTALHEALKVAMEAGR